MFYDKSLKYKILSTVSDPDLSHLAQVQFLLLDDLIVEKKKGIPSLRWIKARLEKEGKKPCTMDQIFQLADVSCLASWWNLPDCPHGFIYGLGTEILCEGKIHFPAIGGSSRSQMFRQNDSLFWDHYAAYS